VGVEFFVHAAGLGYQLAVALARRKKAPRANAGLFCAAMFVPLE